MTITMSILLATDGSPEAQSAAEWLDRWAHPESSEITIATVIAPPSISWTVGTNGYIMDADIYQKSLQEVLEDERGDAEKILSRTREQLIHCTPFREEVLTGSPAKALVDYAKTHHMDLIVMGRRGHSALGNLMGSVSFGVLQRSAIPVTIVS